MVDSIEIIDLVTISEINKMLYQYSSSKVLKQQHTGMVSIKVLTIRHDVSHPDTHESDVRVSVQPIRINLDQVS